MMQNASPATHLVVRLYLRCPADQRALFARECTVRELVTLTEHFLPGATLRAPIDTELAAR